MVSYPFLGNKTNPKNPVFILLVSGCSWSQLYADMKPRHTLFLVSATLLAICCSVVRSDDNLEEKKRGKIKARTDDTGSSESK